MLNNSQYRPIKINTQIVCRATCRDKRAATRRGRHGLSRAARARGRADEPQTNPSHARFERSAYTSSLSAFFDHGRTPSRTEDD
ncbi:hypothetical protein EVAR_539_1 [Eumeta japonica]|uniref:Uncharacterized protein n=1 Tax=Eumeta variegata TaxID=151549 RepID=A0A4C1SAZ5_EUMVA|nr:hypothetical protein EVAR_539_1 [Eumeta japonica]